MDVTGLVFVTHDVDDDAADDWCRWYDLEHLPEYLALPGVLAAQRYHATPELHALRGNDPADAFADGRSSYLSVYQLCDPDIPGVFGRMTAATEQWAAQGRRFDPTRVHGRHVELLRFDWALGKAGGTVSTGALAHLRHAGVQAAMGDVTDPQQRPLVAAWYRDIHAPDMLAVPGVAAALRFSSLQHEGRHLVLFLLDEDPAIAIPAVHARAPQWRAAGRAPSPGGGSTSVFNGPFRTLPPAGATPAARNRANALAFLDAFATRDPTQFLSMMTDDPTWRVFHSERRGGTSMRDLAEVAGRLYPHGTDRTIQSVISDGDRVMVQSILRAVTNAGHDYENYYVMVFEFAPDGRIETVWEYLDLVYARARFDLPASG